MAMLSPTHRFLEVTRLAGEAETQIALAARAEGGARREPDIRLVDEADRELRSNSSTPVHLEEGVERAARAAGSSTRPGLGEPADDLAALARARRSDARRSPRPARAPRRRARWTKTGVPEVEYWMRFSMTWPSAGGASSQPRRQPVMAQFLEKVWTNRIRSSAVITSRKDGARAVPTVSAGS